MYWHKSAGYTKDVSEKHVGFMTHQTIGVSATGKSKCKRESKGPKTSCKQNFKQMSSFNKIFLLFLSFASGSQQGSPLKHS
jgi:hypothetical protein